jgi:hypothetical protein
MVYLDAKTIRQAVMTHATAMIIREQNIRLFVVRNLGSPLFARHYYALPFGHSPPLT